MNLEALTRYVTDITTASSRKHGPCTIAEEDGIMATRDKDGCLVMLCSHAFYDRLQNQLRRAT